MDGLANGKKEVDEKKKRIMNEITIKTASRLYTSRDGLTWYSSLLTSDAE